MKHPLLFTLSLCCALTVSSAPAQPDPIPERALVNAVEKGDRATVLALLNRGVDINKKWINDTPLEAAIFHQDIETVTTKAQRSIRVTLPMRRMARRGIKKKRSLSSIF